MIKFFRKIRENVVRKNRASKPSSPAGRYLLYAIGEIILVVIGILIALQINNWNTNQKDRKLEKYYLNEIKDNLEDDLNSIDFVLKFNKAKDSVINEVFKLMSTKDQIESKNKSISVLIPRITEYQVFLANQVAFNNMTTSNSISLVTNNELRQKLSSYYTKILNLDDFTQEQIKLGTRQFIDQSIPKLINSQMASAMTGQNIMINQDKNFYTDPLTFKNLFNMRMNMYGQNSMLEGLKKHIKDLIVEIEKVQ